MLAVIFIILDLYTPEVKMWAIRLTLSVCKTAVTTRSSQLSAGTKQFKDKATSLYRELLFRQWAPIIVVLIVIMILLYIFWR